MTSTPRSRVLRSNSRRNRTGDNAFNSRTDGNQITLANGSLGLPVEAVALILREVALPASNCDLRTNVHHVVLPPIACQHEKLIKNADRLRADRKAINLVCRLWTSIIYKNGSLYRSLIVTSLQQNYLHNLHLVSQAFTQHADHVRRIDIAYISDTESSGVSQTNHSIRTTRSQTASQRDQIRNRLLSQTKPRLELILFLNRFSSEPLINEPELCAPNLPPPSHAFGSRLRNLNISSTEISLSTIFSISSGCPSLERLALFGVPIGPSQGSSFRYQTMKMLRTMELKLDWHDDGREARCFLNMRSNGLAMPALTRLRIRYSDSGAPMPFNFLSVFMPQLEQLDIEGSIDYRGGRSDDEEEMRSITQLEISAPRSGETPVLPFFYNLKSLNNIVINGLGEIISLTLPPEEYSPWSPSPSLSQSQPPSPSTSRAEVSAKCTLLADTFNSVRQLAKHCPLENVVIGDLGEDDTYGEAWRVIAHHTSFLETEGIHVWARQSRHYLPIRTEDYIQSVRLEALTKFTQEHEHITLSNRNSPVITRDGD